MATPPDPNDQPNWTNPDSGVSYTWNKTINAWDAVFPVNIGEPAAASINARPAGPAAMSWKYDGEKNSNQAPTTGKFYKNGDHLRFSFVSNNGVDMGNEKFNDTTVSFDHKPAGTIWEWRPSVNQWKLKRQFCIQSWRWNFNEHFEFQVSSSNGHDWSHLDADVEYFITVGGFF